MGLRIKVSSLDLDRQGRVARHHNNVGIFYNFKFNFRMKKLYALAVLIAAVGAAPQKEISKDKTEVLDEAESLVLKLSETSKLDRK